MKLFAVLRCGEGKDVVSYSYLQGDGIVTHYFDESDILGVFGVGSLT
ncbi:MAG TPA: hypothetical protein O0W81_02855 [Methanocorpusculum sp.]|nr:hypothetical protein [Methanocorpusculum sp.]HJJ91027.1 hypothetical protein [Methanocorpusculum sp.]HJK01697.1 hypothetical protein [Methanocorpusculum sp.]